MTAWSSQEIAATLAREIAALPPGAKIASEHELMRRFDATRSTVRAAFDELATRFLIRRTRGSGTFVNRRIDYRISAQHAPSLHDTVQAAGATARTFRVGSERMPAPDQVAENLGCAPGTELTRLSRIAYIDDQIASCAEEWLAEGVIEHADVVLKVIESISETLRGSGYFPVRARSRVAMAFPPGPVAERLELDAPVATWAIETLTRDGDTGRALMFSRTWMRPDVIRVLVDFEPTA